MPPPSSSITRPGAVVWASRLMLFIAALGLVEAVAGAIARIRVADRLDAFRAVAGHHYDYRVADVVEGVVVGAAVAAAALVVMTALAAWIRRPAPRARVLAWITCALLALALTCTVAANPNLFAGPLQDVSPEVQAAWDALLPDWYVPVHYASETAMLLASLAVGALLAQTSAHDFYAIADRVADDDPRLWDMTRVRRCTDNPGRTGLPRG